MSLSKPENISSPSGVIQGAYDTFNAFRDPQHLQRKALEIIENIGCGWMKGNTGKILMILAMIVTDCVVENRNAIILRFAKYLRAWMWVVANASVYTTKDYPITHDVYNHLRVLPTEDSKFGVNYYIEKHPQLITVRYVRRVHASIIKTFDEYVTPPPVIINPIVIKSELNVYSDRNNDPGYYPLEKVNLMYPSRMYVSLYDEFRDYIDRSVIVDTYIPMVYILDGEHGLGKTDLSKYLVNKSLVNKVFLVNFINYTSKTSFQELLTEVYYKPATRDFSVYFIDELDKWAKTIIKRKFLLHLDDEKVLTKLSKSQFKKLEKENILDELLCLFTKSSTPSVFVFCSNNFQWLFKDACMSKYAALIDRFQFRTFTRSNINDVIGYLEFYNEQYKNSRFYCNDITDLIKDIPDNITITMRTLFGITARSRFQIPEIVDRLKKVDYSLSAEKIEEQLLSSSKDMFLKKPLIKHGATSVILIPDEEDDSPDTTNHENILDEEPSSDMKIIDTNSVELIDDTDEIIEHFNIVEHIEEWKGIISTNIRECNWEYASGNLLKLMGVVYNYNDTPPLNKQYTTDVIEYFRSMHKTILQHVVNNSMCTDMFQKVCTKYGKVVFLNKSGSSNIGTFVDYVNEKLQGINSAIIKHNHGLAVKLEEILLGYMLEFSEHNSLDEVFRRELIENVQIIHKSIKKIYYTTVNDDLLCKVVEKYTKNDKHVSDVPKKHISDVNTPKKQVPDTPKLKHIPIADTSSSKHISDVSVSKHSEKIRSSSPVEHVMINGYGIIPTRVIQILEGNSRNSDGNELYEIFQKACEEDSENIIRYIVDNTDVGFDAYLKCALQNNDGRVITYISLKYKPSIDFNKYVQIAIKFDCKIFVNIAFSMAPELNINELIILAVNCSSSEILSTILANCPPNMRLTSIIEECKSIATRLGNNEILKILEKYE